MEKVMSRCVLLFYLLHQPYPNKSSSKTLKVHVCSATNPNVYPRKLRIALKTLSRKVYNATKAFPASLLRTSASLINQFFKTP